MTRNEFKQIMEMLTNSYQHKLCETEFDSYWKALKELSGKEVKVALTEYLNIPDRQQFWLDPFSLKAIVDGSVSKHNQYAEIIAWRQWDKITRSVRRYGQGACPNIDSSAHAVLRRMGGVATIAVGNESEIATRRKEFVEQYSLETLLLGDRARLKLDTIDLESAPYVLLTNFPIPDRII